MLDIKPNAWCFYNEEDAWVKRDMDYAMVGVESDQRAMNEMWLMKTEKCSCR